MPKERSWIALMVGSVVTALLASTCCLAPLLFLLFGISVESLSQLQFLAPYHDYLSLFSVGVVLYLWYDYFRYKRQRPHCGTWLSRNYAALLTVGTLVVAVLVSYQYWIVWFLGEG